MIIAAAIQMNSTDRVEENLNHAEQLIRQAVDRGASVVGLPENFAYLRSEADSIGYSQTLGGELVSWLQSLAQRFKIHLLAGSFPETASHEKVYNSSLFIGPDGNLLAHYRKIHLFDVTLPDGLVLEESRCVEAGQELVTANLNDIKVGLTICYDLRFPELYRQLALKGVEVIFVPSAFTLQTGRDHWEVLLRARAIENQVFIVAPAQFGQHTPKRASYGRAMIIHPWGTVLATAADKEGVITAELDFEQLRSIRSRMPCLNHIRLL